jgi:serine phosphatase RsbU (regulator of sigma subunit)
MQTACAQGMSRSERRRTYKSTHTVMQLASELDNFQELARSFIPTPGDIPNVNGIDIFGATFALSGSLGGDLIVYLDFKQFFDLDARIQHALDAGRPDLVENLRVCQRKAGIAVVDVSGHRVTDAFLAATLQQALLLGAVYELDMSGQVTKRLFENLNTRFYQSWAENRFASLIYGEISDDGRFQFLSAASPPPLVFSRRYDRFMEVDQDLCVSFPPLGVVPSRHVTDRNKTSSVLGFKDHYTINQWVLMGEGDILLLHTDGLAEHGQPGDAYCPSYLERTLRDVKDGSAREIFEAVTVDLRNFSSARDDISLVVIKRTELLSV